MSDDGLTKAERMELRIETAKSKLLKAAGLVNHANGLLIKAVGGVDSARDALKAIKDVGGLVVPAVKED